MAGFWDFIQVVAPIAATVYGAGQSSKANTQAATTMANAQQAGTDAQLKGLEMAKQELAVNRTAASPGLLAVQERINRGAALTPEQEMAVGDSRTQALNALKGSSLRGSARATSAVVSDTDQRIRNNFMTQNQNAADQAAMGLGGQYFSAGNSMANNATSAGGVISQGLVNTGNIQGANAIGQGALTGQAIGDVGAVLANAAKEKAQEERNANYRSVSSDPRWVGDVFHG